MQKKTFFHKNVTFIVVVIVKCSVEGPCPLIISGGGDSEFLNFFFSSTFYIIVFMIVKCRYLHL